VRRPSGTLLPRFAVQPEVDAGNLCAIAIKEFSEFVHAATERCRRPPRSLSRLWSTIAADFAGKNTQGLRVRLEQNFLFSEMAQDAPRNDYQVHRCLVPDIEFACRMGLLGRCQIN
jgi:hypothetical protein